MESALNTIYCKDCIQGLEQLDAGTVDLAFADPPFNIGYDYDVYNDRRDSESYLDWSKKWMGAVCRALKPTGTFWLAIGDEYAAELKIIAQRELGLTCRSWVVWYYTFGVNCKKKFSRSHAHLFHFVKDAKKFTFNDKAIRVPSARQTTYGDGRANPDGRLPDDTWILRPQDVESGFRPDEDTVYFPRVAGTFKERAGFHGCQMPEQLLGRIIRLCSNPGDLVLDPFAGSGTTLAVAKKLGRRWLGFELSEKYAKKAAERLDRVQEGQPLAGAPEPLVSAPQTPKENGRVPKGNGRAKIRVLPELPLFRDRQRTVAVTTQAEGLHDRSRGQRPRKR
jgi:site-specific DNA-methyltransferase (adenine-specific)